MEKFLAETKVTARFQERDLRAKVATDSEYLVEASQRLEHSDTAGHRPPEQLTSLL